MNDMSPYELLQERIKVFDPWRMLVACTLLNQTGWQQVEKVIWKLFDDYPTPDDLSAAGPELEQLIRPLGFYNRRAKSLRNMSNAYRLGMWVDPIELPGVGRYARDSWALFVENDSSVRPKDHKLAAYAEWLREGHVNHAYLKYRRFQAQEKVE